MSATSPQPTSRTVGCSSGPSSVTSRLWSPSFRAHRTPGQGVSHMAASTTRRPAVAPRSPLVRCSRRRKAERTRSRLARSEPTTAIRRWARRRRSAAGSSPPGGFSIAARTSARDSVTSPSPASPLRLGLLTRSHPAHEGEPDRLATPVRVRLAVEELFAVGGALGVRDRPVARFGAPTDGGTMLAVSIPALPRRHGRRYVVGNRHGRQNWTGPHVIGPRSPPSAEDSPSRRGQWHPTGALRP